MDLLTERFGAGFCRAESGLFFADGRVVLLTGTPERGYALAGTTTLDTLVRDAPDDWEELEPRCEADREGMRATAGGGTWEAEGYVALFDASASRLSWLLHLRNSEIFTTVALHETEIVVTTEEYPTSAQWRIPRSDPVNLRVSTSAM